MNWFKNLITKITNSKAYKIIMIVLASIGTIIATIFFVMIGQKSKWLEQKKEEKEYEGKVEDAKEKNEKVKDKAEKTSKDNKKVTKDNKVDIKKIEDKNLEISENMKKYYKVVDTHKED